MADVNCLKTVLVNTSGKRMYFPFIGAHGGKLDNNQEYTADGDLFTVIMGTEAGAQHRRLASFLAAVLSGKIQVKNSATPFVFDSVLSNTRTIGASNGSVVLNVPCYQQGS